MENEEWKMEVIAVCEAPPQSLLSPARIPSFITIHYNLLPVCDVRGSADWAHLNFSSRNTQKAASRDTEGSLKKSPSDSIRTILPPCRDFGRVADGRAKRKIPIAFRVRRSRFPCIPWFDYPLRMGGTVGLVGASLIVRLYLLTRKWDRIDTRTIFPFPIHALKCYNIRRSVATRPKNNHDL